jgi:hypothetical protein
MDARAKKMLIVLTLAAVVAISITVLTFNTRAFDKNPEASLEVPGAPGKDGSAEVNRDDNTATPTDQREPVQKTDRGEEIEYDRSLRQYPQQKQYVPTYGFHPSHNHLHHQQHSQCVQQMQHMQHMQHMQQMQNMNTVAFR